MLCERDLCEWIAQPAATWSNVGFFVAALVVWRWARRDGLSDARFLAPIALWTGLGSIAFHATGSLAGQLLDQSVMFLETALFLVMGLRRLGARVGLGSYLSIVGGSTALLLVLSSSGIARSSWHLLGASSFLFWYRHFAQR